MFKNTTFFLFFFLTTCTFFSQNIIGRDTIDNQKEVIQLDWIPTYDEALERSKIEKKPVLIYFTGSDWCGPCILLDKELFHTEKFKQLSDEALLLLEVDSPRNQTLLSQDKISENLYLKNKYKVQSFPTLVFVNHKGKKIAEKKGYIMTEYYYPFIVSVVNNFK